MRRKGAMRRPSVMRRLHLSTQRPSHKDTFPHRGFPAQVQCTPLAAYSTCMITCPLPKVNHAPGAGAQRHAPGRQVYDDGKDARCVVNGRHRHSLHPSCEGATKVNCAAAKPPHKPAVRRDEGGQGLCCVSTQTCGEA
eukprot:351375-Chlamydomonas_euryale.AAC.12